MEHSSATDAEWNGDIPEFYNSLVQEVEAAAANMTVEVILLLIDKWEKDMDNELKLGQQSIHTFLDYYVKLKISLHHLQQAWDRGWSQLDENQFTQRLVGLTNKTKEARRKYYVAKRRYQDGEHGNQCTCRGCRCIKGL